jgi:single-strand selective monofunctional uracil DNA glycosylase
MPFLGIAHKWYALLKELLVDLIRSARQRAMVNHPLIIAAQTLSQELKQIPCVHPVTHIYNPLDYAWNLHRAYISRYGTKRKKIIFLGMNPGPFGMAQTGVPFGEIAAVRDWLQISGAVDQPPNPHPKRPITGLACKRAEVSGRRLWGLFKDRFGTPDKFFADHYVVNWCPLAFMESSGKNFTPDHLPKTVYAQIVDACDRHLAAHVREQKPQVLVGVGKFAATAAERVIGHNKNVRVATIPHPSPANPAANKDWAGAAIAALKEQGVW